LRFSLLPSGFRGWREEAKSGALAGVVDDDLDSAADADGASGAIADAVIERGLRRVRRGPAGRGGVGAVALAAAGDSEAVTKSQADGSW
jgi:hypothetical protein